MNFDLTKEQLLIQKTAHDFAEKYLVPAASQIDKENHIPDYIMETAAELELLGIPFREEFGGADGGYDGYVLAMEQIAKACSGMAVSIGAHTFGLSIINKFGNEDQKKKYMIPGCTGKCILSGAWTEPATGSDPVQITSIAEQKGDSYILNGTKRFISNAQYPGAIVVFAREVENGKISAFIVDKWSEGYSISEPWNKIGQHGGQLMDVYLKDVRIPLENKLEPAGEGYKMLQIGISFGKVGVSSTALGIIASALEESVKYVKEKTHRGEPIARFQAIQLRIADLAIKYETARWLTYRLGQLANQAVKKVGQFPKEAALTKIYTCDAAVEAAKIAIHIHGSYGVMNDYKATRIYRDSAIGLIIEGVEDMQKLIVAKGVLDQS